MITNLDLSLESSRRMKDLANALKAHHYDAVLKENERISNIEYGADQAHMKAVESIVGGSFFGGIREDILALLEQIDNIADSAKGASRVFYQRRIPDGVIDYLFKEDLVSFIESLTETVELLKDAILSLGKSKKDGVISLSRKVEKSDDAIRTKVVGNLLRNEINAERPGHYIAERFS